MARTGNDEAWAVWRENTLAEAQRLQAKGRHREARALAAMVRDTIPRWAVR
jgi:hypothetical protein